MRPIAFLFFLTTLPVFCFGQSESDFGRSLIPDYTFEGSELDGWQVIGNAEWQASNGEIIGKATSGGSGWLVLEKSFQDVGFHTLFKCVGECETGVLFRMEQTDQGFSGILLTLNKNDIRPYRVILDDDGEVKTRKRLQYAGGIWYRIAPEEQNSGGFGPPEGENTFPQRPEPDIELPFHRPDTGLKQGQWNLIEVFLDANVIRSFLNDGREIGGRVGSRSEESSGLEGYGPIALYAGGTGEVRFKDVMVKDILVKTTPDEKSSPRFRVQRINDMYYSWGVDAADFNQNGHLDVIAGPYIYYGPGYTERTEIFPAVAAGPSTEFNYNKIQAAYDFNGNGWPDVLSSAFGTAIYINPESESRRWNRYTIPAVGQSEITELVDIDRDGIPELVYAANGTVRYAKPDVDDPTQPWNIYNVSEEGYGLAHGIGTGDINGNGRLDIVNPFGWWEQPSVFEEGKLWRYHPVAFGRYGRRATGVGGSLMGVYDVNGNGLNDVVAILNAHGFGLAWYEQQRDGEGNITFIKHMISDDYSAENAGGVTFSQPHGNTFADIDGDGIPDFIVGKRHWTHLDNYADPDPHGPPVLYWYRTVRDRDAPGGARFVPELIHNRSGAGSEIKAVDLNNNGSVDIITSTNRGTFIFWNTPDEMN